MLHVGENKMDDFAKEGQVKFTEDEEGYQSAIFHYFKEKYPTFWEMVEKKYEEKHGTTQKSILISTTPPPLPIITKPPVKGKHLTYNLTFNVHIIIYIVLPVLLIATRDS